MKQFISVIALALFICAVGAGITVIAQAPDSNYRMQGGNFWGIGGGVKLDAEALALTSPTLTFSALNHSHISLTSDANLTGVYPINGVVGQVVNIISGAGSNTIRFDDGTSMTIGANITLTEAQNDVLTLICTDEDGDEWARISNADN